MFMYAFIDEIKNFLKTKKWLVLTFFCFFLIIVLIGAFKSNVYCTSPNFNFIKNPLFKNLVCGKISYASYFFLSCLKYLIVVLLFFLISFSNLKTIIFFIYFIFFAYSTGATITALFFCCSIIQFIVVGIAGVLLLNSIIMFFITVLVFVFFSCNKIGFNPCYSLNGQIKISLVVFLIICFLCLMQTLLIKIVALKLFFI